MSNKYFALLSLAALLTFSGCKDGEDLIVNNDGGGETTTKECGYVAVNIVQPTSMGGHGSKVTDTDNNFEDGNPSENNASEATFFIFKENGDYVSTNTVALTTSKTGASEPNTEKIYDAVLVLELSKNLDGTFGKYNGELFCVLNAPDNIKNITSITKDDLRAKVADYCTGHISDGKFIMTNSVYNDGTDEICGAKFTTDDFMDTPDAATSDPVDIYVERVVAKVRTSKGSSLNADTEINDPRNTTDKITVRITGLEIANIANSAYLFKNITAGNNAYNTWPTGDGLTIHDPDNRRCYWEYVPSDLKYTNKNYNTITDATHTVGSTAADNPLTNWSLTDCYILPNTSSAQKTSVLVTAQLLKKTTTDGTNTYAPIKDLVWMMGGYTTSESAKNIICTYLATEQYAVKYTTDETLSKTYYATIVPGQLEWKRTYDKSETEKGQPVPNLQSYQAVAQVIDLTKDTYKPASIPDGATITSREVVKYDFLNKEEIEKSTTEGGITTSESYDVYDVNNDLVGKTKYFADVFTDGLCYYFVELDQSSVLNATAGTYQGVVRNHIYDLSLNRISGIGTAIFDPKDVIIPERPKHDGFSYLAARINVLSWKLVKQDISFEGQ